MPFKYVVNIYSDMSLSKGHLIYIMNLGSFDLGFTLFIYEASNSLVDGKNIHFVILRFKGNRCEFSVYIVRIFMKCTHVCAAQKAY